MPTIQINFNNDKVVYSRLKNGVNTKGIEISTGVDIFGSAGNVINLTAITTKGLPAMGHLSLPKDEIDSLISALIQVRDANTGNS